MFNTDTYFCSATHNYRVHTFSNTQKNKVVEAFPNDPTGGQKFKTKISTLLGVDKVEWEDHRSSLVEKKIENIPVQIISPITHIIWLWMCDNWRNKLDFVFKRSPNWNDDTPVTKFNDSLYVQYQNIFDWHDWVKLHNGSMIYAGLIVDPNENKNENEFYYYVENVEYSMPDRLKNILRAKQILQKKNQFTKPWKNISKTDYYPDCYVCVKRLVRGVGDVWVISDLIERILIDKYMPWSTRSLNEFVGRVVKRQSQHQFVPTQLNPPQLQHPDVRDNKPFFFGILACDKYKHTMFTGLNSMQTHGFYWWLGNCDPDFQFTRKFGMVTCQAPAILSLGDIFPKISSHWQHLMQHGCVLPTSEGIITAYGMIAMHVTDMQDKDVLMRRRNCSKQSKCDGMLWLGYEDGSKWPDGCNSLLELNTIMPGPYMLQIWQYLKTMNYTNNAIEKTHAKITISSTTEDIYNELPIDSTIKGPLEINHTTVLGLLKTVFEIEWTRMHDNGGYDELSTRAAMIAYLDKFWVGINGMYCFIEDMNTDIFVFNQIHHSWQKFLEIMMSLSFVCDWDGNVNLFTNLVRMTGCFHICDNENRRKQLQQMFIPVFNAS